MKRVNDITVCRDNFKSKEEFEDAIKRVVMVLLENGYVMTIKYDEPGIGIVWIKFCYDAEEMGDYTPVWLSPEEYESIIWDDERPDACTENNTYTDESGVGVRIKIPHGNDYYKEIVLTETNFQKDMGGIMNIYISSENIDELIYALNCCKK